MLLGCNLSDAVQGCSVLGLVRILQSLATADTQLYLRGMFAAPCVQLTGVWVDGCATLVLLCLVAADFILDQQTQQSSRVC